MLDKLRKILELERTLNFGDKAVVGGLDKFLHNWALQAHQMVRHPMFRSSLRRFGLVNPAYGKMPPKQRAEWAGRILRWADALDMAALAASGEGVAGAPESSQKPARPPGRPPPGGPPRQPTPPRTQPRPPVPKPAAPAAPAAPRAFAPRRLLPPGQGLEAPLAKLNGVGEAIAARFAKLGVETVRDLLFFFPRRHIDFSHPVPIKDLEPGRDQTVVGTVWEAVANRFLPGKRGATQAVIGDETGNTRIIWFNLPYLAQTLRQGMRIAVSGRVTVYRGRLSFENPEYELADGRELVHTARLVPVYPLTEGLTSRRVRTLAKRAVDEAAGLLQNHVPETVRRRQGLMGIHEAVRQAHFPESLETAERARRSLAFDELLLLQLGVLARKRQWRETVPAHPLRADPAMLDAFATGLPFQLTGAQRRCIQETVADLARSTPMSRLLQGEVGSGKTVVALAAMLVTAANGQQAAIMAPTEILAEQHFRTVTQLLGGAAQPHQGQAALFGDQARPERQSRLQSFQKQLLPRPVTIGLLTGGLTAKRKDEMRELAAQGEADILIGTHALFQKGVEFASLGLVVVDEQHRFGVMQRTELRQKGYNPHLLVMTATPIPRTLALTLYGDLDISVIDELPPGRQVVRTKWIEAGRRETAYEFVRKQVAQGRQAFFIYPLIEESERSEAAAARQEHERLSREVFPDLRVALLHGRMASAEKERVMREFREGKADILVSTAVVEVGIDVPNATVMAVESADRFGLAQLHQFRGRVGRGRHESYCILVAESPGPEASERLRLMEQLHDGFRLAEEDLRLRGPGEFFGTRQSGLPDLRMARLSDTALLETARQEASAVFAQDPALEQPEHRLLAQAVERAWRHRTPAPGEA